MPFQLVDSAVFYQIFSTITAPPLLGNKPYQNTLMKLRLNLSKLKNKTNYIYFLCFFFFRQQQMSSTIATIRRTTTTITTIPYGTRNPSLPSLVDVSVEIITPVVLVVVAVSVGGGSVVCN